MRLNTFRYLLKEGLRSLRQNAFMSVASILVLVSCLLVTGCAYLLFENVEHAFREVYKQNVAMVYVDKEATDADVTQIQESLNAMENVAAAEFLSKEALLERYDEELGSLLDDLKEDNPLQDSFKVQFHDLSAEKFTATVEAIKALAKVEHVDYDDALSATLVKIRNTALAGGSIVIVLLLVVSLFIIANTIKLTVYSRRLEISIMRAVGATPWFVRFPFMVEGILLGCSAGVVSYGLVFGIYAAILRWFTFGGGFALLPFSALWWQLLLGFVVGGMITGMLGSVMSIGRYLKENME